MASSLLCVLAYSSLLLLPGATAEGFETAAGTAGLRPARFRYGHLDGDSSPGDQFDLPSFQKVLAQQGILAVDMGADFQRLRHDVLVAAASCMDVWHDTTNVSLPGGTIRRTLAGESNSIGDGRVEPIFTGQGQTTAQCEEFEHLSMDFRKVVGAVADAFLRRLLQVVKSATGKVNKSGGIATGSAPDLVQQLTSGGPRLEHFHVYTRDPDFAAAADPETEMRMLGAQTLDFHVDQGLFVVFSPGMALQGPIQPGQAVAPAPAAGRFSVRSADANGNSVILDLDIGADSDSTLVIVLGDAVRQLGIPRAERLFHVPSHAFRMPAAWSAVDFTLRRLWYGLMQLPPQHLVAENVADPTTQQKLTFRAIRKRVAEEGGESAIGCSPLAHEGRRLAPRLLEDAATCQNGSIACWHRCMEISDAGITQEQCEARGEGHTIQCVSQFNQVYRTQDGHGDFNPACSNATEFITPRPIVVQLAAGGVTDMDWAATTEAGAGANAEFGHRMELDESTGNTVLLWRFLNETLDGSGGGARLHAKMVHRGHAGWMAFGLENVGGRHNGMNGGQIVMGGNDPAATPNTWVGEFLIDPVLTAFRHWKTPLAESEPGSVGLESSSFSVQNGVSVLEFKTRSIYKKALNLSTSAIGDLAAEADGFPQLAAGAHAVNRFIWGLTHNAYCTADYGGYCAYHSATDGNFMRRGEFRGTVAIDLARGLRVPVLVTTTPLNGGMDLSLAFGSYPLSLSQLVTCVVATIISLVAMA